jgi:hypothetical protein
MIAALSQFERRLDRDSSEWRVRAAVTVSSVPAYRGADVCGAAPDQLARACRVRWKHAPAVHAGERPATAIAADVSERDATALAVAPAVSETSCVSAQQSQAFNAAGITQLVAISGLHVTLFALPVLVQWSGATATPPEFQACRLGGRLDWDEVQFELLDGASCALWARSRRGSALVANGFAHSDWVLAPRHGYAARRTGRTDCRRRADNCGS